MAFFIFVLTLDQGRQPLDPWINIINFIFDLLLWYVTCDSKQLVK